MQVAVGSKSDLTWMEALTRQPAGGGGAVRFFYIQLEREEEEERLPGDRQMKRVLLRKGATASCLQRVKQTRGRGLMGHRDRGNAHTCSGRLPSCASCDYTHQV